MRLIRQLFFTTACTIFAACGSDSQSELYGRTDTELSNAPTTVSYDSAVETLEATGQAYVFPAINTDISRVNPVTGQLEYVQGSSGDGSTVWLIGLYFTDASGGAALADWTAQTAWIIRSDEIISTRDFNVASGTVVATFLNPPFKANNTKVVVEGIKNGRPFLISALLPWP